MGRQGEKRQVGAARRRSRGHGLARLDGTRTRATVADKVMKSGETAGHGNGRPCVPNRTQAQARRPGSRKPGRRRQPSGARERWKPVRGETRAARLDAQHDSATGHVSWPGTLMQSTMDSMGWMLRMKCRWCARVAALAQPGRRYRGAPSAARRGWPHGLPLECKRSAQRRRREGIDTGRSEKKRVVPKDNAPDGRRAISAQSSPATARSRRVQRIRMPASPRSAR